MSPLLEKVIAEVVAIVLRIVGNQLETKDQALALELAADKLKVKAAAQRALDKRRAKR